jgi:hypothetical protein
VPSRSRRLPVQALLLALATAAAVSVAFTPRAAAIVSADPDNGTPNTNGRVNAVAYLGGTVYIGGSFTSVNGQARNRLPRSTPATGRCWRGTPAPTAPCGP